MKHPILNAKHAALLVVDIQEAFRKSITGIEEIVQKTATAVRGFELLECPVLITEQYPKGLGHTFDEITSSAINSEVFEKSGFSALCSEELAEGLEQSGIRQVVIAGIEAHVCVNQTVHGLIAAGYSVHILEDAVGSRFESDRETALKKMYLNGALPSSVEMALFELLVDSKSPKFKDVQNLIK